MDPTASRNLPRHGNPVDGVDVCFTAIRLRSIHKKKYFIQNPFTTPPSEKQLVKTLPKTNTKPYIPALPLVDVPTGDKLNTKIRKKTRTYVDLNIVLTAPLPVLHVCTDCQASYFLFAEQF